MECKECFHCGKVKPLSEYRKTEKKYSRPEQLGCCIGCKDCTRPDVAKIRIMGKYLHRNQDWWKTEEEGVV